LLLFVLVSGVLVGSAAYRFPFRFYYAGFGAALVDAHALCKAGRNTVV